MNSVCKHEFRVQLFWMCLSMELLFPVKISSFHAMETKWFDWFLPRKDQNAFVSWLGSPEAQRRLCYTVKNCFRGWWVIDWVKTCREMLHWNEKFVLWLCWVWVWSCRTLQVFKKSNSLFLFGSFEFFEWLQRLWLSTNRGFRILEFKK